jgi:hypothetical protein
MGSLVKIILISRFIEAVNCSYKKHLQCYSGLFDRSLKQLNLSGLNAKICMANRPDNRPVTFCISHPIFSEIAPRSYGFIIVVMV